MKMSTEDQVFQSLSDFMNVWRTKDVNKLTEMVDSDVHAYFSTCGSTPDCSQHSLYGVRHFIDAIPQTQDFNFEITNFICRKNNNLIRQYAEVACIASDNSKDDFQFVALFANVWSQSEDELKLTEIRMDIQPISGTLFDKFKKEWLFEPELAVLSGSVHLPCIFPELDSPYQYGIGDMGELKEVIHRYFFGVDQLCFTHVKEVMDDSFEGGKYQHIVTEKFLRQRHRYCSHPYTIYEIQENNHSAEVTLTSILDRFYPLKMRLIRRNSEWKIIKIEEINYEL